MNKVKVNDFSIHYEFHTPDAQENRNTILFLHGLGSSLVDWRQQRDAFKNQYPLLLADLRGHGESDNPQGVWSIEHMAADMACLIKHLSAGPVHAVGLSMGAQVGMQLALDYPDLVISITAINSPADMVPKRWRDKLTVLQRKLLVQVFGMRKVGEVISKRLFPDEQFREYRKQFAQRWANNDPTAYRKALDAILRWDITHELHKIDQPLLVIAASDDYTPLAWKERIVNLAPDASLQIIQNSRHATPVDQADVFNQILGDFLRTVVINK